MLKKPTSDHLFVMKKNTPNKLIKVTFSYIAYKDLLTATATS